ncbi:hypothetical protein HRI_000790100 [Hibiscus trionum]|uniref:Uncharacterized protein n=1 Tax=Hibiscus trionum TaxID=183268 RepID=A0A9W7LNM0_HIBTR|nr:hypothetical protein HRI_000790100 [Hibiscus trionum]
MFTPFFPRLRKGLKVSASRGLTLNQVEFDGKLEVASPTVPDGVKEGYFTVFAVKGKETQRYVIELDNLTNPTFLSLLELASSKRGFFVFLVNLKNYRIFYNIGNWPRKLIV